MSRRDSLRQIAQDVPLPRRPRLGETIGALFMLATGHRRIWGDRGVWGRVDPFRAYDASNPAED